MRAELEAVENGIVLKVYDPRRDSDKREVVKVFAYPVRNFHQKEEEAFKQAVDEMRIEWFQKI